MTFDKTRSARGRRSPWAASGTNCASRAARFQLVAGCDKTPETCHARFGNIVNFRGEPHIPGNDKVFSYPVQGGSFSARGGQ